MDTPWVKRFLEHPAFIWVAIFLPLLLCVSALGSGIVADDYIQRFKLLDGEGLPPGYAELGALIGSNPLLTLFQFFPGGVETNQALVEMGTLPWWSVADAQGAFFRPLTSATHMLDYGLFPDNFVLQHLHNFLWAGLGVWVVSKLYRQHIAETSVASIALLAFALEDAHAIPNGWLANRNAWVALVFGGLVILRHTRRKGAGPDWMSGLLFALALAGGEMGLCAMAYVGAWELVVQVDSVKKRALRVLPYGLVLFVWLAFYKAWNFGAYGSGLYTDPLGEPLAYLSVLPMKFGALAAGQVLQAPSDIWVALDGTIAWWSGSLASLFLVFLLLRARTWFRGEPKRQFWLLGSLLSLLPVCASFPMERLLLFAGIGFFALIALAAGGSRFSKFLLFLHIPVAAVLLPLKTQSTMGAFQAINTFALADDGQDDADERILIVLNSVDVGHAFLPLIRQFHQEKVPIKSFQLANLSQDFVVERLSENAIRIHDPDGYFKSPVDQMTRGPRHPMAVGYTREVGLFQAYVERVTPDGRPTHVRFEFPGGVEDPLLRWTVFDRGVLQAFKPPPVGKSVEIRAPTAKEGWRMFRRPEACIDF